ncbi:hypothetical protein ACFPH6_41000 [Streptomyces xiangluensis]|uniref:Uncharacterized protein n=1 Tax=Streptomyces xiangluensis TaxID=2665720 RepID=A0ABV8Z1J5_9ACTN
MTGATGADGGQDPDLVTVGALIAKRYCSRPTNWALPLHSSAAMGRVSTVRLRSFS